MKIFLETIKFYEAKINNLEKCVSYEVFILKSKSRQLLNFTYYCRNWYKKLLQDKNKQQKKLRYIYIFFI